jgi:hypothetical protein
MVAAKKHFARYGFIADIQALWRGDPSQAGAQFREIVMTSADWLSVSGTFQVYALSGTGNGIVNGKFFASEPTLIFDEDVIGFEAARSRFEKAVTEALGDGFGPISFIEEMEFLAKLQQS